MSAKSIPDPWYLIPVGYDETLEDVRNRVLLRYPLHKKARQHDAHVVAWESAMLNEALDASFKRRYEERERNET